MDVVYARPGVTAVEVRDRIPDPPSPTAVRTWLRILEEKGQLRHQKDGRRHLYYPVMSWKAVQRSAVSHLLKSLFGGSPSAVVAALLDVADAEITETERDELLELIRTATVEER